MKHLTTFLLSEELWDETFENKFSQSPDAQSCVATALRSGTLLILRDDETGKAAGTAVLDFSSYAPNLFVNFVLASNVDGKQLILRRRINLQLVRLAILRGAGRLIFHTTMDKKNDSLVLELNKSLTAANSQIKIELLGDIQDLYGDGVTRTTVSLFIEPDERPDVMKNVVNASNEFYKTVLKYGKKEAIELLIGGGVQLESQTKPIPTSMASAVSRRVSGTGTAPVPLGVVCCSGCSEKTDKDGSKDAKEQTGKEFSPDKPGGKEGVDTMAKLAPEKGYC